jgi:hypothetical protein
MPKGVPNDPEQGREVRRAKAQLGAAVAHGNKDDERRARKALETARAKEYSEKAKALRASARSR